MNKRNQTRPKRRAEQQNGRTRWRTYSLICVCTLMLVCGFFFAARQHFSSMDFGMKNSRLRKQVDELEAEKRRLLLAREISLSPSEIKKAAKKTGLLNPARVEGEVAQVVSSTREKAIPPSVAEAKSMIIKTAAVSAVQSTAAVSYRKTEKLEKPVRQAKTKLSNN